ncbi:hypothetical protein ACFOEQ_06030 [Chryseobacterium arachidis]|uniref:hypothetical protein n=1 Tax=Chryseobacterium arachidis TaxID=1416778 RepID=UPI0036130136
MSELIRIILQTLDVNGELRIRILPSGNEGEQVIVSDQDGNILKTSLPKAIPSVGDIKDGYSSADHEGWYLLNGRALSAIPATAQTNAASLGFIGNLPDFSGKYTKMIAPVESINTVTGNTSYMMGKANMPNFSMTAVTAASGAHAHLIPDMRPGQLYEPGVSLTDFQVQEYIIIPEKLIPPLPMGLIPIQ